jgi:hypothetical protein
VAILEDFEIIVASPSDHDGLVAELYHSDALVAVITQDGGDDVIEVCATEYDGTPRTVRMKLASFISAATAAIARLNGSSNA